jgi:hypothetical protein
MHNNTPAYEFVVSVNVPQTIRGGDRVLTSLDCLSLTQMGAQTINVLHRTQNPVLLHLETETAEMSHHETQTSSWTKCFILSHNPIKLVVGDVGVGLGNTVSFHIGVYCRPSNMECPGKLRYVDLPGRC